MTRTKHGPEGTVGFVIGQLEWGGAERQMTLLASALHDAGVLVRVACLSERLEPYGPVLRDRGVDVASFGRRDSWDVGRWIALMRWIRAERPEVVFAFGEYAAAYAVFAARAVWRGPRVVAMLRRSALRLSPVKRVLVRAAMARADAVCANSEAGREYGVRHLGVRRNRCVVLRNVVPREILDLRVDRMAVRAALGVPPDANVVIYVGRTAAPKDIPTLCRTIRRLAAAEPRPRVWVVGPGLEAPPGDETELGGVAAWLGVRADVPQLIAAADVLLLTSRNEGTPNVVLEAMALGRPVVSTAAGDTRSLLEDGPAGVILPVGDDAGLADAVLSLLKDPEMRRSLGERGRRKVEAEFSLDAALRELRSLGDA